MMADPALAALRSLDAAAFRRLRTALTAAIAEGHSQREVWRRFILEMGPVAVKHLPEASDEALAAMVSFWAAALAQGGERVGCRDLLAGDLDGRELRAIEELTGRYSEAIGLVLQSAAAGAAPAPDRSAARDAIAALQDSVPPGEAATALLDMPVDPVDPAACRVRVDFLRAALALPAGERGATLRVLLSH
jgi:hypothetical protein